jgi:hypothetical protein
MGKKQEVDLDDILGEESQEERKAVKSARLKALAPQKGASDMASKKAKEKEVSVMPDVKPAARAKKNAKGAEVKEKEKPVKKTAGKAKPATNGGGEKAARGEGKYYFDPDEKAEVMKQLVKIKKPITTAEYAQANDIPTWKVRLAAVALKDEGKLKMTREGGAFTLSPK